MKLENLHKAIAMSGFMSLAITGCVHHAGTDKESQVLASAQGAPAPGLFARLSGNPGTGTIQDAAQWPEKPDESRTRAKFNQLFPHLSQRLDRRAHVEVGQPIAVAANASSMAEPVTASFQSASNAVAAGLAPVQEAAGGDSIQAQASPVASQVAITQPQASPQTTTPLVQTTPAPVSVPTAPVSAEPAMVLGTIPAAAAQSAPAQVAQPAAIAQAPSVSGQSAPVAPAVPAVQAAPVAASPQIVAAPAPAPAAAMQTAQPLPVAPAQPSAAPAVTTSTLPPIDTPAAPPEIKPNIVNDVPAATPPATATPAPVVAPALVPAAAPAVTPAPAVPPAPPSQATVPTLPAPAPSTPVAAPVPARPAPVAAPIPAPAAPPAPASPAPTSPAPAPAIPATAPVPARPTAEPPTRPEPKKPSEEVSVVPAPNQAVDELKSPAPALAVPGIPATQPSNSNPVVAAASTEVAPPAIPAIPDSPPVMASAPAPAAEELVQQNARPMLTQAAPAQEVPAIPAIPARAVESVPASPDAVSQVIPGIPTSAPAAAIRKEVEQVAALPVEKKLESAPVIGLNQSEMPVTIPTVPPIPSTSPVPPPIPAETVNSAISAPDQSVASPAQAAEAKPAALAEAPLPAPAPEANISNVPAIPAISNDDQPPEPLLPRASTEDPRITKSSGTSSSQPVDAPASVVKSASENAGESPSAEPATSEQPATDSPVMKVPTDEEPVKVLQPLPDDEASEGNETAAANESARIFRKTENGFVIRLELKNPLRRWTNRLSDEPVFRPTQSGLASLRAGTRDLYERGKTSIASRLLGTRPAVNSAPAAVSVDQPEQIMAAGPDEAEKPQSSAPADAEIEDKPTVVANPVDSGAEKIITASPSSPAISSPAIIQPVKAQAPAEMPKAPSRTVANPAKESRSRFALSTAPGLPPIEFPATYGQSARRTANPWANQINPAVNPVMKPDLQVASYDMLRSVKREVKPVATSKTDRSIITTSMTVAVDKPPVPVKTETSRPNVLEAASPTKLETGKTATSEKESTTSGLLKKAGNGLREMIFGREEVVPPKRQNWATQNWSKSDPTSLRQVESLQGRSPGFNRLSPGL